MNYNILNWFFSESSGIIIDLDTSILLIDFSLPERNSFSLRNDCNSHWDSIKTYHFLEFDEQNNLVTKNQ